MNGPPVTSPPATATATATGTGTGTGTGPEPATAAPDTRRPIDANLIDHELTRARQRTLALLDALDEEQQRAQHSPLMSPMVWDLAHIGNYEELWLLRAIDGRAAMDPELDDLYNAFEHPRWTRPGLPILGPDDARAYLATVRAEVLDLLGRVDLADEPSQPLLRAGFVYGMVIQHEHQHDETLLATHQLRRDDAIAPPGSTHASARPGGDLGDLAAMRTIDAGPVVIGSLDHPWAYDNELDAHVVDLPEFRIAGAPTTNREYLAFLTDGGYDDTRLWSDVGWAWRQEAALEHPEFWRDEGGGSWSVLRFGSRLDLADHLDEAVQHVCWYEADAFARWAGLRLPTELEWEKAAGAPTDIEPGDAATWRRPPANHAASGAGADGGEPSLVLPGGNLGQRHDGPAPVGSPTDSMSPWGCRQMIGDVWEWTSSRFGPHPGFRAFPYAEYSEVFWGDEYQVLKGGSWATDPTAVRISFRNWDYPIRRQIFAGFRCAEDP